MPQGQQKSWYGKNAFMWTAKVLFFAQLHIGKNWEMVAQLFMDAYELFHFKPVVNKNIVDPQYGRYPAEGPSQPGALFNKAVLHGTANGMISIAVGKVIEVAA